MENYCIKSVKQWMNNNKMRFWSDYIFGDKYTDKPFDIYYVNRDSLKNMYYNEDEYDDFHYKLMEKIKICNHTDDIYLFSDGAFVVEHSNENTNYIVFNYNNKNYPAIRRTVCSADCHSDYTTVIEVDRAFVDGAIIGFTHYDSFLKKILSEDESNEIYDVYYNNYGHPKELHDKFGGNSVKDFANQLASTIKSLTKANDVYDAATFGFAVKHNDDNADGFLLCYGGIKHYIQKKIIYKSKKNALDL